MYFLDNLQIDHLDYLQIDHPDNVQIDHPQIDHSDNLQIDPSLPISDVVRDLHSTDDRSNPESPSLDHSDYTAPAGDHELDHSGRERNLPCKT